MLVLPPLGARRARRLPLPTQCSCRQHPTPIRAADTPTLANENSVALIERIITKASLLPAEAEVLRARRDGAGIVYEFEGERWALEDGESGKDGAVGGRERVGARARRRSRRVRVPLCRRPTPKTRGTATLTSGFPR
jgi:hypothetical protein